ncbi:tRNA ligase 1 [Vitis vinifera]|uniref:tRNA ligase 1 n=1 Tax=Vitis vinifera TaxID=29760 RepID=A0A438KNQ8_VITVI|nr:tRNA ligase 1 [Vitis vinifera]
MLMLLLLIREVMVLQLLPITACSSIDRFPVDFTALLFSDKMAALEAYPGSVDGERITSKNQWPHVTLWTGAGVAPKEANMLPELISEGTATRIDISPPITISGTLEFF